MSTDDQPLFSLVLATYGRADVLVPLVETLLAQIGIDGAPAPSFEVIVADQNPDDRVVPLIAPLRAAGRLGAHIRLPEPNLSRARNAGLAAVRGRFVAFPDDDCWYEPDTLARAARHVASDPRIDGLAARWIEAGRELGDEQPVITRAAMRRFRGGNLSSITLFLRQAAVEAAGGFDERIGVGRFFGSGEETDLVFRLLEQGGRLVHAPDVAVHLRMPPSGLPRPVNVAFAQERRRARGTGAYTKHRLPTLVVLRGLLAPLPALSGADFAAGAGKTIGRIEGLVRWQLEKRKSRHRPDQPISYKDDRTT